MNIGSLMDRLGQVNANEEKGRKMQQQMLLKIWPDVANALGVGRSKAFALVKGGEIKAVKLSERSYRVTPQALQEYVERLEAESGDAA